MGERSILTYDKNERIAYIEKLFLMYSTQQVLETVLIKENMNLEISNLIIQVTKKKNIQKHLKTINALRKDKEVELHIKALLINVLFKLNKIKILAELIKTLDHNIIIKIYEYDKIANKTILQKYIQVTTNQLSPKKKHNQIWTVLILGIIMCLIIGTYFWMKDMRLLKYYQNKIYPNFYIYNVDISKKTHEELDSFIESIGNNIKNKEVVFQYDNKEQKYSLSQLGLTVDYANVLQELKSYDDKLSYKEKLKLIKSKDIQKFQLNISYDDAKLDKIVKELKNSFNRKKQEGTLKIDSKHNVKYDYGHDGFVLNEEKTKKDIINILETPSTSEENLIIQLSGEVTKRTKTNDQLRLINKKVASYTTTFANYGSRGHNITLAASKANGTILQPGEVFSYRKVVGPYNRANGYQSAPIQQNGATAYASGGGVCQLTTTIFNAQLLAGLETVYRTNHGAPVAYAPRGMDATVYGDSVDYKFKNSYKYPIYISVYTTSTTLTVDIWSNDNAMENKTYKPYVVAKNALEYFTYLEVYQNGKKIENKYIGYSYYIK